MFRLLFLHSRKHLKVPNCIPRFRRSLPLVIDNSPPSDAIILFNGINLDQWVSAKENSVPWRLADGCMTVKPGSGDIKTKRAFGDCQLHVEWRCPSVTGKTEIGREQGFGNSGILLQGRYELQVFDSYNYPVYHNDKPIYTNGQAGSYISRSRHLSMPAGSRVNGRLTTLFIRHPDSPITGEWLFRPGSQLFIMAY